MAFKLTYSDGQESQHDDDTVWELDDGVLKLGREEGKWSVLLSPSHWAVLEFVEAKSRENGDAKDDDDDKDKDKDKDDDDSEDKDSEDNDSEEKDSKDSDDDEKKSKDEDSKTSG
ncbi:MAG TPA: hypothetical protein VIQ11_24480 [Mycobacterium sp.]